MKKISLIKVALMASLLMGLVWGAYSVTLVKEIKSGPAGIGAYDIEDMQMCADGKTAVMVAVARNDDARLYKYDLEQDKAIGKCSAGILYGPRGGRGLAVNGPCTKAYLINYPINTISVLDVTNIEAGQCVAEAELTVAAKPTGIALAPAGAVPSDRLVITNSLSDTVTVVNTTDNTIACEATEVGFGPNGAVVLGQIYLRTLGQSVALVINTYDDTIAVINHTNCDVSKAEIKLPDRGQVDLVVTPNLRKAYVVGFVANAVSVIDLTGLDARKAKIMKSIPVGNSPKYIAISPDGKFVFVSNTTDKTVSVIDTAKDTVVKTIVAAGPTEPAAIKWLAVTNDNRYLYVYYPGGRSGTYADFTILKFDVGQLYGG